MNSIYKSQNNYTGLYNAINFTTSDVYNTTLDFNLTIMITFTGGINNINNEDYERTRNIVKRFINTNDHTPPYCSNNNRYFIVIGTEKHNRNIFGIDHYNYVNNSNELKNHLYYTLNRSDLLRNNNK